MSRGRFMVAVTGHLSPQLEEEYGDFGQMTKRLLAEEGEEWICYNTCDGEFPDSADLSRFQGIIVTGSPRDAFSKDMPEVQLRSLLAQAHQNEQKLLGICFGAQALAIALGGQAGRAEVGLEVGSKLMQPLPAMREYFAAQADCRPFYLHESHQDQISQLPRGAVLLANSSKTPIEIWALGSHVLGIQGHPEFSPSFMQALVQWRAEKHTASPAQVQQATQELHATPVTPADAELVQRMCKRFLYSRSD